jgi:hypothetical protein
MARGRSVGEYCTAPTDEQAASWQLPRALSTPIRFAVVRSEVEALLSTWLAVLSAWSFGGESGLSPTCRKPV